MLALTLALAMQRPGDADYPTPTPSDRHTQKVAALKAHHYDLLMIGDSITHTVGDFDGEWAPLKQVWRTHFAARNGINLGYSGYRTENILWHMQNGELDFEGDPKVAVLNIGTNNTDDTNYKTVHTAEQIFKGTKAIVDTIRSKHPTTKVLVLGIFPRGGAKEITFFHRRYKNSDQCVRTCEETNNLTKNLADGKHVFFLNLNKVFFSRDGSLNTDLIPDLVHPNFQGAETWANALEPTLARLMGDKPIKSPQRQEFDAAPKNVQLLANKRVLVLGDSITQDGRYVSDMQLLLERKYTHLDFNWFSIGLGSETVSGLTEPGHPFPRPDIHERLGRALETIKPEVVMACYGMNDGIYHPYSKERQETFQRGIASMVEQCRKAGAKVVLVTPPAFDSSQYGNQLTQPGQPSVYGKPYAMYDSQVLAKFAEWEVKAKPGGAIVVDLHTPMSKVVSEAATKNLPNPVFYNQGDGIHPNDAGHMFMAQTILDRLGAVPLDGPKPAENLDLPGLISQCRQTRSEGWLSYIGYTRGEHVKTNEIVPTEDKVLDFQARIDKIRRGE